VHVHERGSHVNGYMELWCIPDVLTGRCCCHKMLMQVAQLHVLEQCLQVVVVLPRGTPTKRTMLGCSSAATSLISLTNACSRSRSSSRFFSSPRTSRFDANNSLCWYLTTQTTSLAPWPISRTSRMSSLLIRRKQSSLSLYSPERLRCGTESSKSTLDIMVINLSSLPSLRRWRHQISAPTSAITNTAPPQARPPRDLKTTVGLSADGSSSKRLCHASSSCQHGVLTLRIVGR